MTSSQQILLATSRFHPTAAISDDAAVQLQRQTSNQCLLSEYYGAICLVFTAQTEVLLGPC